MRIAAFFRAMSLFRQNKPDEARKLATSTAAAMMPMPMDEKKQLSGSYFHDDQILWLAHNEANVMIKFAPAAAANLANA